MKKKDVELLKGSIGKWLKIKQSVKAVDVGADNCSLCVKYFEKECEGCPIYEYTGEEGCADTPYDKWHDHQEDLHDLGDWGDEHHRFVDCDKCAKLANEMLGFLVGLLPVKEIKKIL